LKEEERRKFTRKEKNLEEKRVAGVHEERKESGGEESRRGVYEERKESGKKSVAGGIYSVTRELAPSYLGKGDLQ
jgi:hypothetical protein